MLQSVRWLFRTLSTERKALITLQDRLLQEGVLPAAPGRTHKLNHPTNYILCRYLFSAGGDDWVMDFTNSNLESRAGTAPSLTWSATPTTKSRPRP